MTRIAKIERKTEYFPIIGEVKATNDAQGIIEGYLNYTGNIDFGDDRTMRGAFKRTLTDSYARKSAQSLDFLWPYLWNHDYNILPPGGIFDADEYKEGLYTKTRFNMEIQLGRELYSSFKMGTMKKQSMGYKAIKYEYVKEGGRTIRNLLEVAIMEGSAVVFPMNDLAVVDTVKSTGKRYFMSAGIKTEPDKKDFNATYQARVQSDWLEDLWNLWFPLKQEVLMAFQDEDPIEATRVALDQFGNAMLAYVQQGVDLGMVEALQPNENGTPMMYMSDEPEHEAKHGRTISAANHSTMTKAVAGIMEHCKSINGLLQSTKPVEKPEKSLGAAELPQETTEAKEDDAVSTHLDELLASVQLANLGRQLKSR